MDNVRNPNLESLIDFWTLKSAYDHGEQVQRGGIHVWQLGAVDNSLKDLEDCEIDLAIAMV